MSYSLNILIEGELRVKQRQKRKDRMVSLYLIRAKQKMNPRLYSQILSVVIPLIWLQT